MNYTFTFAPEVLTPAEAIETRQLDDMALYFDRQRKGHNGDYMGGTQRVVLSRCGEEAAVLGGEEVTRDELLRLSQTHDLLILAGSVDPENGDMEIDEAVLVVQDPVRANTIAARLSDPAIIQRFKQLALFACLT